MTLLCDQAVCSRVPCAAGRWSAPWPPWGRVKGHSQGHSQTSQLLSCSQPPPGLSTASFKAEKLVSSPMDPHTQALLCAHSQEITGGCGFTPALLLSPVTRCKSLLWLAVDAVPARSGQALLAGCAGRDSRQRSRRSPGISNCFAAKASAPSTGPSCSPALRCL